MQGKSDESRCRGNLSFRGALYGVKELHLLLGDGKHGQGVLSVFLELSMKELIHVSVTTILLDALILN